jgi:hypothetical protein
MCLELTLDMKFGCGHLVPLSRTGFLQCTDRHCASSATHPADCQGFQCRRTCTQVFERGGEYVVMEASAFCGTCRYVEEILQSQEAPRR